MRTTVVALLLSVPAAAFERQTLFQAGQGGYMTFRIPALVATEKGGLVAACEARKTPGADWGSIDLMLRRSGDGGKTWGDPWKFDVGGGFEKNPVAVNKKLGTFPDITVNNPVLIADKGVVHFLYCVEYFRCFYSRSEDDGKTFAPPIEITRTFEDFRKDYDWKVIATGPGHGIRLGKSGRLVVPVWLSTGEVGNAHRPSAVSVIVSDDAGKSWQRGDLVSKHPDLGNPSETAAVELPDGRVMLNIRHEAAPHFRAVSVSDDGMTKWSKPVRDPALPEPVCMGSLVRDGDDVLFSNPFNPDGRERKNLSVQRSRDGGKTWTARRAIERGLSGYSDLEVGGDGTIHCLYERIGWVGGSLRVKSLELASFRREWLDREPERIVCLGDSAMRGIRSGIDEADGFAAQLEHGPRIVGLDVEAFNAGVANETSEQGLKRLPALLTMKPDRVILLYGAADASVDAKSQSVRVSVDRHRANLTAMVRLVKEAKADVVLMTSPSAVAALAPYQQACREVAESEKVLLVDHAKTWIAEKWDAADKMPNRAGYAVMVERYREALEMRRRKGPK